MVCGYTLAHKTLSGKRGIRRGTQQATPALTETAQAPTNKRNQPNNTAGIHRPTSIVCWAALWGVDCPSVRAAQAVSLCLASATCDSSRRHTSHVSTAARSRRLPHQSRSPILEQSLSNSNLIGFTLIRAKAVIGPSLSKMSLRIGAVPKHQTYRISWGHRVSAIRGPSRSRGCQTITHILH